MSIRLHLVTLVLFCAFGGLALGAFLIDRQDTFTNSSVSLALAQQQQHDVQRLEDVLKQLLIATDLLFGSGETYMLNASRANTNNALKMTKAVLSGFQPDHASDKTSIVAIETQLRELLYEIDNVANKKNPTVFDISKEQLAKADEITASLVMYIELVKRDIGRGLSSIESQYNKERNQFDFLAWSAVGAYLFSLLATLALASRAVSNPLAKLSTAANQALTGGDRFKAVPEGPTEVQSLAKNIGRFVDSLEHNNAQSEALIEAIPDTLFVVRRDKGIVLIKPGIDTDPDLLNKNGSWTNLQSVMGARQAVVAKRMVLTCLKTQKQQHADFALSINNDHRYFEARATAINHNEVVVVIRDRTEKRQAESRIRHMAYHDSLTGLLNRRAFKLALTSHFEKTADTALTLFYVDVDRFKGINDTHGHDAGDDILRHVTQCLSSCLRTEDTLGRENGTGNNLSARMGGDEFVLLLPGIEDEATAISVAERLQRAVGTPFDTGLSKVTVTISIGIAIYPDHGRAGDQLMLNADLAMFQAKRSGGAKACVYSDQLGDQNKRKMTVETKLQSAIEQGNLFLVYQPKVDLQSRLIVGAEALVRWQDGDNVIPPDEFIPIAEETGLILPLGDFVTATAIKQIAKWRKQNYQLDHMAINVSAAQLKQDNYFQSVLAQTIAAGIPTSALNLEITESLLMDQYDNAMSILTQFREGGFTIAMDDFGTGYSSLSYIKDLPLDILKIDRAFVSGITESSTERAIIAAIIKLGKTLGLRIVAEGVETNEHLRFLTQSKCDEAQGYLFSAPVTAEAFEGLLREQESRNSLQAIS